MFITYSDLIDDETKSNLIEKNKCMVDRLLELRSFNDQANDSTGIVLISSSSDNTPSIIDSSAESEAGKLKFKKNYLILIFVFSKKKTTDHRKNDTFNHNRIIEYDPKIESDTKIDKINEYDTKMISKLNEFESDIGKIKYDLNLNKFDCKSLKQMIEDMRKDVNNLINYQLDR